jgi:hypothetical protein
VDNVDSLKKYSLEAGDRNQAKNAEAMSDMEKKEERAQVRPRVLETQKIECLPVDKVFTLSCLEYHHSILFDRRLEMEIRKWKFATRCRTLSLMSASLLLLFSLTTSHQVISKSE